MFLGRIRFAVGLPEKVGEHVEENSRVGAQSHNDAFRVIAVDHKQLRAVHKHDAELDLEKNNGN